MASSEDITKWASKKKLSRDITDILKMKGFDTVDALLSHTPANVIDTVQSPKRLSDAKCKELQKALTSLHKSTRTAPRGQSKSAQEFRPRSAGVQYESKNKTKIPTASPSLTSSSCGDEDEADTQIQSSDSELRRWVRDQGLSPDIADVLENEGFSMDHLRQMARDDFKEFKDTVQTPRLLPGGKCLDLKNAMKNLLQCDTPAQLQEENSSQAKDSVEEGAMEGSVLTDSYSTARLATAKGISTLLKDEPEKGDQGLRNWAESQNLSSVVVDLLVKEKFDMEYLRRLTLDDFNDFHIHIQSQRLLPAAECMKLKEALKTLCDIPNSPTATNDADSKQISSYVAEATCSAIASAALTTGDSHMGPTGEQQTHEGAVEEFRLLMLGKTGSGKSTTGNVILGEKLFTEGSSFNSCTAKCELNRSKKGRRSIEIMDSPGLCDTQKSEDEICTSIVQTVACTHPGPDAILYIVRIGRYTNEDFGVYKRLKALFDENITNYLIVLFTGGDDLEENGNQFDDMLEKSPETLRQVIQECDNRVVLFDNKAEAEIKQAQVESLFTEVRKMKTTNGGRPYTCPKYATISESLEAEVRRRLKEVDLKRDQSIKELELKIKQAEEEAEEEKKRFEEGKKERAAKIAEEEAKYQHQLEQKAKELSAQNLESLRGEMEGEKMRLINELKEQSELERQEMERKLEDIKKLMVQITEEKSREEERWQKKHEEQMEQLKDAIAKDEEPGFIKWAVGSIASIVAIPFNLAASLFTRT